MRSSGSSAPTSCAGRAANCAVDSTRYSGTSTSPAATATKPAAVTVRSDRSPGAVAAAAGRATSSRNRNSPIAAITLRVAPQRAATRPGVAAVSRSDGTANWRGGPGPGPTANVNAPRTGCPSAEITRQYARYQPGRIRPTRRTIVRGSPAERSGPPRPSGRPRTSVIEMAAKRGSTFSLNVSASAVGVRGATRLAAGDIATSDACARALAGATAQPPSATTTASTAGRRARALMSAAGRRGARRARTARAPRPPFR
jgi:hypothetical protein